MQAEAVSGSISSLFLFHIVLRPLSIAARRTLPLCLALLVKQVPVPCCCSSEFRAAVWARGLGRLARFLALVPQEVAESRKLAAVAAVLPALRLGPALNNPYS